MERFASMCLAETNMMAVEAILNNQLIFISDKLTELMNEGSLGGEHLTVEGLRGLLADAEIPSKTADIKKALGGGKESKKTKKAKKAGQKRPTAYLLFCGDNRSRITEENPGIKGTDVMRKLGAEWKALDDEEKKVYKERSENWEAPESDDDSVASEKKPKTKKKKADDASSVTSEKKKKSKKKADDAGSVGSEKKKKKLTGYMAFSNAMRPKVKEEEPGIKNTDVMKKLGAMWKELSDEEKAKWKPEESDSGEKKAKRPKQAKLEDRLQVAEQKRKEAAARKALEDERKAQEDAQALSELDDLVEEDGDGDDDSDDDPEDW